MNGWFHSIPPRPTLPRPSIAPEDVAIGRPNPITGVNSAAFAAIRSAWPQENWAAQRGATVASTIAAPVIMSTPLPFAKPAAYGPLYRWFEGTYSLVFSAGTVANVTVQTPPPPASPPIFAFSIAAIRNTWPEPQWEAQAESTLGSIFAQVANAVQVPAPSVAINQALIGQTWPQPEWRGQSESAVAGALAPILPGPIFVSQQVATAALLIGLWPRETWNYQTAPHTMAWLPQPITAIPKPVAHNELYSWPQESWNAQSGSRIAGQLSFATLQVPPRPDKTIAEIVSIWGREQWPAQSDPGVASGLAQVVPPIFVSRPPLSQTLTSIVASWPQPAWDIQSETNVASLFAQTPPVQVAVGPTVQGTQTLWPQEAWSAQGSPTVAAKLAQLQVPPLVVPNSTSDTIALLTSIWPQESWSTQRAPQGAAWIQLLAPVSAGTAPPPHIERLAWQQEQWAAQQAPRIAGLFATITNPQPTPPVQQQITSIWPSEQWPAQQGATVASQFALVFDIPFVPQPVRMEEILSWPQEQWAAQTGAQVASKLVSIPLPASPAPVATLGTIRFSWPQEDWNHQRGARGAAAFAPAPPVVPFISLPQRTQLISSWPQELWGAQQAPNGAYINATIQPPPPPPPPTPKTPQKHANLGYKVTTRTYNLLDMVSRSWGGEFRAPDHRVYEFSNGRTFDSTDMGTTGIYRKK